MKVLLKKDVKNIGRKGDIVEVKEGFGRNHLLTKGLGVIANQANIKSAQTKKTEKIQHDRKIHNLEKDFVRKADSIDIVEIPVETPLYKALDKKILITALESSLDTKVPAGFMVDTKNLKSIGKHRVQFELKNSKLKGDVTVNLVERL